MELRYSTTNFLGAVIICGQEWCLPFLHQEAKRLVLQMRISQVYNTHTPSQHFYLPHLHAQALQYPMKQKLLIG